MPKWTHLLEIFKQRHVFVFVFLFGPRSESQTTIKLNNKILLSMVLYLFLILTLCFSFCFWFLIKWFGSDSGVNIANKLFPTGDTNDRESYYWLLVISNYWGSSLSWVKDNRNSILLVSYVDLLMQEHISYPWKTGQNFRFQLVNLVFIYSWTMAEVEELKLKALSLMRKDCISCPQFIMSSYT